MLISSSSLMPSSTIRLVPFPCPVLTPWRTFTPANFDFDLRRFLAPTASPLVGIVAHILFQSGKLCFQLLHLGIIRLLKALLLIQQPLHRGFSLLDPDLERRRFVHHFLVSRPSHLAERVRSQKLAVGHRRVSHRIADLGHKQGILGRKSRVALHQIHRQPVKRERSKLDRVLGPWYLASLPLGDHLAQILLDSL